MKPTSETRVENSAAKVSKAEASLAIFYLVPSNDKSGARAPSDTEQSYLGPSPLVSRLCVVPLRPLSPRTIGCPPVGPSAFWRWQTLPYRRRCAVSCRAPTLARKGRRRESAPLVPRPRRLEGKEDVHGWATGGLSRPVAWGRKCEGKGASHCWGVGGEATRWGGRRRVASRQFAVSALDARTHCTQPRQPLLIQSRTPRSISEEKNWSAIDQRTVGTERQLFLESVDKIFGLVTSSRTGGKQFLKLYRDMC